MKRFATRLCLLLAASAPLCLTACADARIYTIGDLDRYWSDETRGITDGYTVGYWAKRSDKNRTLRDARNRYSVANAEDRFSDRVGSVADSVAISRANDAINHDKEYQELLNDTSLATLESDWSDTVDKRYDRPARSEFDE